MVEAVRLSKEHVERLEKVIEEFIPTWSLAPQAVTTDIRALFTSHIDQARRTHPDITALTDGSNAPQTDL
jgi:hypothetical protein